MEDSTSCLLVTCSQALTRNAFFLRYMRRPCHLHLPSDSATAWASCRILHSSFPPVLVAHVPSDFLILLWRSCWGSECNCTIYTDDIVWAGIAKVSCHCNLLLTRKRRDRVGTPPPLPFFSLTHVLKCCGYAQAFIQCHGQLLGQWQPCLSLRRSYCRSLNELPLPCGNCTCQHQGEPDVGHICRKPGRAWSEQWMRVLFAALASATSRQRRQRSG